MSRSGISRWKGSRVSARPEAESYFANIFWQRHSSPASASFISRRCLPVYTTFRGYPPSPLFPKIFGVIELARISRQNPDVKELRAQSLDNKGVRPRARLLSAPPPPRPESAYSIAGRKVGCHTIVAGVWISSRLFTSTTGPGTLSNCSVCLCARTFSLTGDTS